MALFDNLKITNSQYIPQYQGLPLEEVQKTGDVLQERYYTNLANADRIDLMNEARMATEGDTALNQQIADEYKTQVQELADQGNYENMTGQVSALAKRYLGDKKRIALEGTYKAFEEEQALAEKMRAQGKTPIGLGDRAAHKSYDPETGQYNIYRSQAAEMLDYRTEQEELFNDLVPNAFGKSIGELTAADKKALGEAASVYFKTRSWQGITDTRIKNMLQSAMTRYKGSDEYRQQKLHSKELYGVEGPEADKVIEDEVLSSGLEKVFGQSRDDIEALPGYLFRGAGGGQDGVVPPFLLTSDTEEAKNTKKYADTIPGRSPVYETRKDASGAMSINAPGTGTSSKLVGFESTYDQITKPDYNAQKNHPGFLEVYDDLYQSNTGEAGSQEQISGYIKGLPPAQAKAFEEKAKKRYTSKLGTVSEDTHTEVSMTPDVAKSWKFMFKLDKDQLEEAGFGLLDNSTWTPISDEPNKEPFTLKQIMESTEEGWLYGDKLDAEDPGDIVEFKKQISMSPSMMMPTKETDAGFEITLGDQKFIVESPLISQKNNPYARGMKSFNAFLQTPTSSSTVIPIGAAPGVPPTQMISAEKEDLGYTGDVHNGFKKTYTLYDIVPGEGGVPMKVNPRERNENDILTYYMNNMMMQNPYGIKKVGLTGSKDQD